MSNRLKEIREAFAEAYGFNPHGIYCQVTGKLIGFTTANEFNALVESIDGNAETTADDIAMRVLASMRPSLQWNKMREATLEEMRQRSPIDTLAYLLNRAFAPIDSLKTGVDNLLAHYEDRIKIHQWLSQREMNDSLKLILHMLLEIDAKLNLNREKPTFTARDFLDSDGSEESLKLLVQIVEAWYNRRMEYYSKTQSDSQAEEIWSTKGNTLARQAFFGSWMESKPVTKTAEIKAAKKAESDMMTGILAEMLGNPSVAEMKAAMPKPTIQMGPVALPSTKMRPRFGGLKKAEG